MFRAKRNYPYADLARIIPELEYKIGINDNISLRVASNNGAVSLGDPGQLETLSATVEFDGTVKIPLLGRVYLKGLSLREAELLMEERYKQYFVEPYVKIMVGNKRVIIFRGRDGAASVLQLRYNNMNLLEALASIGGLTGDVKAHRIKLIRGDLKNNPQVYLIDLSRIENLADGGIILQGNDIIYIEPRDDIVLNTFQRITPYVAVLNFGLFVYALIPGK